jgi:putative tryptophan/tyrosine transport system substrate-binding protein
MRRREFIAGVGSAAGWPFVARAQQGALPTVGYLEPFLPEASESYRTAFRKGLREMSFFEGRNVTIEYHSSLIVSDRARELAAELVRRRVAVIVAATGNAALAAKSVTSAIPIVFASSADPGEESSKLGRQFRHRGTKATFFPRLCLIERECA